MAAVKRLGRGLEALLGKLGDTTEQEATNVFDSSQVFDSSAGHTLGNNALGEHSETNVSEGDSAHKDSGSHKIDVLKIEPNPFQPRKTFDETELEQFAQVIQAQGLLHPIIVRKSGDRYQIIAGERRFRAVVRLGWSEIPVKLYDADDQTMVELALTENIQRKDLNPIEKAVSFANYLEVYGGTHDNLANRLKIDRSTVTNLLRLLKLPQQLQEAVCQEKITQGHVRALLTLEDYEKIEVAAKIEAEGWSVRETEKFVQELTQTGQAVSPRTGQPWNIVDEDGTIRSAVRPAASKSEHLLQLEDEFRQFLGGLKVQLTQTNEKGKGKLTIAFANHEEFERIYAIVCTQRRAAG